MGREVLHTIMLPPCTDTLLAVMGTPQCCHIRVRVDRAQKYRFVLAQRFSVDLASTVETGTHLIHTSIREQQRWIIIWDRG